MAVDGGSPPRTGSLAVCVTVTEAVDDGLQFVNVTYDVTVDENVPASTVITRVSARSGQTGADVTYSFDDYTMQQYGQVFYSNCIRSELQIPMMSTYVI